MPTLLCAGFGYSARALAPRMLARGWRVIGTTRDPGAAASIEAEGVEPVLWPPAPEIVAEATHLVVSAAPEEAGDPVLQAIGPALTASDRLEWVGYLSTTGVYGDKGGDWVDEDSPLAPTTRRGALRVSAEAAWRATGLPVQIFRLAGIYGPGRGPFRKLREGSARRIIKPGQVFSRVHRDDIAAALAASIDRPNPGAVYNVCDDLPAASEDVIAYAAQLLGMAPPAAAPFEEAEMTPMARSFYSESKRVSNRRLREELGVTLAYPTYREGLAAALAEEKAAGVA